MKNEPYSQNDLLGFSDQLEGKKVLVYGDIMLDRYLHGDTYRISPEAPVPVVQVNSHRLLMGGAGNVARNIHSLNGKVSLLSACGDDNSAIILDSMCKNLEINAHLAKIPNRKTTTKNRIIARHQQMLRFDEEDTAPLSNEYQNDIMEKLYCLLKEHDVLILSDYGKGLINQSFIDKLRNHIQTTGLDVKLVVDPKTPNYRFYQGAYLLTPNAKEASEATNMPTGNPTEIRAAGLSLMHSLGLSNLLITLGAHGMVLFESNGTISHIPTTARDVFDVTGAGDTVIATISLCLATGIPLLASCIIANYAAGIVVAEVGAASVSLQELKDVLQTHDSNMISSWE